MNSHFKTRDLAMFQTFPTFHLHLFHPFDISFSFKDLYHPQNWLHFLQGLLLD
jgi:hypothetical protein